MALANILKQVSHGAGGFGLFWIREGVLSSDLIALHRAAQIDSSIVCVEVADIEGVVVHNSKRIIL